MKHLYILILFAHLWSVGFAQDRILISPFGDAIPVEKGISARQAVEKNAESHLDANTIIAPCDSPTISFGNIYDPSQYATNFAFAAGDVAAMIYRVPFTGIIESVYFKPNANTFGNLDASLRIFKVLPGWATSTATYFGYDQVRTPDSCVGASPWPSTCPYVPGASGTGRFLGEELWGLGGFPVAWPNSSSTVGVRMFDLGYVPSVNAGDMIAITLRKAPFDSSGTGSNAILRASAPSIPFRFFKYYNFGRTSPDLPGWWSREFDMFIWAVIRVPPPLIDFPPTIVSIVGPPYVADTSEQAVRMYAYDSNCIMPGDTGILAASLYYSVNGGPYSQIAMVESSGVWIGHIPGQPVGSRVSYCVTATDVNNHTSASGVKTYRVLSLNQFGYTTTFPPFTFTNLAGTEGATELPGSAFQGTGANDDGTAGPVPIGGNFNFFGRDTMRYVWVSANGGIGMTGTANDTVWVNSNGTRTGSFTNFAIPGTAPRNFVAGFWNDLYLEPGGHGSVWYKQDGSQLIIQWNRVGNFNSAIDTTTTFQIVLDRADNSVTFKYLDVGVTTLNTSCLLAMQASSPNGWLLLNQFGYPESTRPHNNFAMKMTYIGPLSVHGQGIEVPATFALHANYPNPFNPATKIRYELPRQVNVTLKVFNLLGQEVASLVNEVQSVGKHEVEFRGESLSSGVYFYRLFARPISGGQAGDPSQGSGQWFAETKKLVLLK